ncbi:MAG: hypothetical protein KDJ88_05490 [Bauldia sp.]|nr:hypothetical protein [Bauldia sp.]
MAVNFSPVGSEFQATGLIIRGEVSPNATVLTDGRWAVAYQYNYNDTDRDIRLQFLNPDGSLAGSSLGIDLDSGYQIEPVVVPRLDGGAAVIWRDYNGYFNGNPVTDVIELRLVSATGQLSAPLLFSGDADVPYTSPDAATLTNGQVAVVFEENYSNNTDLVIRVLDAAGTGFPTSKVIDGTSHDSTSPVIAASGTKALIAYVDNDTTIRTKLFDSVAQSLESDPDVLGRAVGSAAFVSHPDVAALKDGRYVVVWENDSNSGVQGRFVDAAGNPIGSVFTIANNAGANRNPKVAALPDGGFIVSWDNNGGVIAPEDGVDLAVLARRFDASGAAAGDLFLVNTGDPNAHEYQQTVAVNQSTGRTLMVWTDLHSFTGTGQDSDPPGIRGHIFRPTTDVVNGTAGDDKITTYSLGEHINGLSGNDTIYGRAGNDTIDGGPGSDLLFGEAGNDFLGGGDGADTENGGPGNDLLDGGPGNDTLTGGPGADRFEFSTSLKPKGANIDTIVDFSAPDDTILLDNAIFRKLKIEGPLKAKFFEVGKKAKSKKDFIIYNQKNGDLIYDKNGSKKGGVFHFAKLEDSPHDLSAADFLVI